MTPVPHILLIEDDEIPAILISPIFQKKCSLIAGNVTPGEEAAKKHPIMCDLKRNATPSGILIPACKPGTWDITGA
jgi:hypothetical protein